MCVCVRGFQNAVNTCKKHREPSKSHSILRLITDHIVIMRWDNVTTSDLWSAIILSTTLPALSTPLRRPPCLHLRLHQHKTRCSHRLFQHERCQGSVSSAPTNASCAAWHVSHFNVSCTVLLSGSAQSMQRLVSTFGCAGNFGTARGAASSMARIRRCRSR